MIREAYSFATSHETLHFDELCAKLNRPRTSVSRKARLMGLTNRAWPKVEKRKGPPKRKFESEVDRRAYLSKTMRQYIKEHGHPRGNLGNKHTDEVKANFSDAIRRAWRNPNSGLNSPEQKQRRSNLMHQKMLAGEMRDGGFSRCLSGKRLDLGDTYFRSSWEANYARFLNFLKKEGKIVDWSYETKTFLFESVKLGTRSYTPDFRVVYNDGRVEWHEVKGWMDPASKIRLAAMEKFYPDEKIVVIGAEWFKNAVRHIAPIIPFWERSGGRRRA